MTLCHNGFGDFVKFVRSVSRFNYAMLSPSRPMVLVRLRRPTLLKLLSAFNYFTIFINFTENNQIALRQGFSGGTNSI